MLSPMAAIETRGLTKYYGRDRGIEGVDLEVHPGEVFGFLGPNGAGKTTTIRLLLDLIRPSSGSIRVLGLDPRAEGVSLRRRVGYLPGDLALYGKRTPREFLRYFGRLRGDEQPDAVDALAERFSLHLDRPIGKLSKGNRQKVGLVQAFVHDPEVLFLDEPTAGLDPLMQQEFEALVREAALRGACVFLSSHALAEVQAVADRAGIIRDGRLVAIDDVRDLRAKALLEIEIRFAAPVGATEFAGLAGVRDVSVNGAVMRCRVEGRADPLIKALARHEVESISGGELDLEDIFLAHYGPGAGRESVPDAD